MRGQALYKTWNTCASNPRSAWDSSSWAGLTAAPTGRRHTCQLQPVHTRLSPISCRKGVRPLTCHSSQHDPGKSDGSGTPEPQSSALVDWVVDPSGNRVFLLGLGLLAAVFTLPRLALVSTWAIERALVSTLLSFEQVTAAAGFTLLRWAAYALGAFVLLSVAAGLLWGFTDKYDDALFDWARSMLDGVPDDNDKAAIKSFLDEKEQRIREQKAELDRLMGSTSEDDHHR